MDKFNRVITASESCIRNMCRETRDGKEVYCPYMDAGRIERGECACKEFVQDSVEVPVALIKEMSDCIRELQSVKPVPVARLYTLEEIKALPDLADVWLEEWGTPLAIAVTVEKWVPELVENEITFYNVESSYLDGRFLLETYNKNWRCWTSRPTEETREAMEWDEMA